MKNSKANLSGKAQNLKANISRNLERPNIIKSCNNDLINLHSSIIEKLYSTNTKENNSNLLIMNYNKSTSPSYLPNKYISSITINRLYNNASRNNPNSKFDVSSTLPRKNYRHKINMNNFMTQSSNLNENIGSSYNSRNKNSLKNSGNILSRSRNCQDLRYRLSSKSNLPPIDRSIGKYNKSFDLRSNDYLIKEHFEKIRSISLSKVRNRFLDLDDFSSSRTSTTKLSPDFYEKEQDQYVKNEITLSGLLSKTNLNADLEMEEFYELEAYEAEEISKNDWYIFGRI